MQGNLIDNREPFKVGDRVLHKTFGEGFVQNVSRTSSKYHQIEVEFDEPSQVRNLRPTRYRKLVSTYLEKIDVQKVVENDDQIQPLEVEGLEGSNMVVFKFENN